MITNEAQTYRRGNGSSRSNLILVVQSVSASSFVVWLMLCCLATRHTKLRKHEISNNVTCLPTIYLVETFGCNQLSLRREGSFASGFREWRRCHLRKNKQESLLTNYNELISLDSDG